MREFHLHFACISQNSLPRILQTFQFIIHYSLFVILYSLFFILYSLFFILCSLSLFTVIPSEAKEHCHSEWSLRVVIASETKQNEAKRSNTVHCHCGQSEATLFTLFIHPEGNIICIFPAIHLPEKFCHILSTDKLAEWNLLHQGTVEI